MIKEFDKNNVKYKVFSATDTIVEEIKNTEIQTRFDFTIVK